MVNYPRLFAKTSEAIYSTIYNHSAINLKNNIKMSILNKGGIVRGMLYNNLVVTTTPDSDYSWLMFEVDRLATSNLLNEITDWVSFEDILNTHKINVDLVTASKKQIPSCMAFCKTDRAGRVFIAIDARVYRKYGETSRDTHLIIHFDSDIPNNRTLMSHIPIIHPGLNEILGAIQSIPTHQMTIFVNGLYCTPEAFNTMTKLDTEYYELFVDENIIFRQTVDLTSRDTFFSTEEELYKDLVILNVENTGIEAHTYDTMFVAVMNSQGIGVYLPYLADESVASITHTSFSLSSYLIDAAFDLLGVTSGKLDIRVSRYSKNGELVPNGKVTEKLYMNDDSFIRSTLLSPSDIPFWGADAMEKSTYAKVLTNFDLVKHFSTEGIRRHIECLGYYEFAKILCKSCGEFDDLGIEVSNITIQVPIFWEDTAVFPLIYLDGNKVPHSRYLVERVGMELLVSFPVPIETLNSNSIMSYQLILDEKEGIYTLYPSQLNEAFTIPKTDRGISIFMSTAQSVMSSEGPLIGYVPLPSSNNQYYSYDDSGDEILLMFTQYGHGYEFVVIANDYTNHIIQPNFDISGGGTISFVPKGVSLMGGTVPILIDRSYDVYVNRKFLVPGLDYTVKALTHLDTIGGYQITLQNLGVLDDSGPNLIEIYQTNQRLRQLGRGYVVDGVIPKNVDSEAVVHGLSRIFINGKVIPKDKLVETTTHYQVDPEFYSNGNTYCILTGISDDFDEAFREFEDSTYFAGRGQIVEYFASRYTQVYSSPLVVPYMHRIYSSYLNTIIHGIIDGTIAVNYINDDYDIIHQLANYEYLKKFDVMFDNPIIDKRFTDIYPNYLADLTIVDLNKYRYIQRLVRILLHGDADTDHLPVYIGN